LSRENTKAKDIEVRGEKKQQKKTRTKVSDNNGNFPGREKVPRKEK
jgi:hypothetical protein